MSLRIFILTSLGLLAGLSALSAQPAGGSPPEPATAAPAPAVSDEQALQFYGWWISQRVELARLTLSPAEFSAFARGVQIGSEGGKAPGDQAVIGPALSAFLEKRATEANAIQVTKNRAEEEALFASLDAKPEIKKTESGLRYEVLTPGDAKRANPTDTVTVNYRGTFVDGNEFDASPAGKPAQFALNGVIPGWTEGLRLIGTGGKIKLYVPGKLAYGDEGRGGIPPAKVLLFEVELLAVQPAAPQLAPDVGQPTLITP